MLKLFLNFDENHPGAWMGYPEPLQMAFKHLLQVHQVYVCNSTFTWPLYGCCRTITCLFRNSVSENSLPNGGNSSK